MSTVVPITSELWAAVRLKGWTPQELRDRAGVGSETLRKLREGGVPVSSSSAERVADALGFPADWLFRPDRTMERRWPLATLLEGVEVATLARQWAERCGGKDESRRRMLLRVNADHGGLLNDYEADELCTVLGTHPAMVWGIDAWLASAPEDVDQLELFAS